MLTIKFELIVDLLRSNQGHQLKALILSIKGRSLGCEIAVFTNMTIALVEEHMALSFVLVVA